MSSWHPQVQRHAGGKGAHLKVQGPVRTIFRVIHIPHVSQALDCNT